MVEIKSYVRIVSSEDEAHAIVRAAGEIGSLNKIEGCPRYGICRTGGPSVGLPWNFGPFIFSNFVAPEHPLRADLQLVRDVVPERFGRARRASMGCLLGSHCHSGSGARLPS